MNYLECPHCLKKFTKEGFFKKHQCQQMIRHELMRKPIGLKAYEFYCQWLKAKGFMVHSKDQFMDSRSFKPFINFSKYSTRMALPAKNTFIKHMVELDVSPKDWTNKLVYDHYMKSFDTLLTPEEQFEVSVDTLYELSRIYECEVHEIFLFMDASDLIRIVQAKKLTPWFLLHSKQFQKFVQLELTREQKILLEKVINPVKWEKIFKMYPKKITKFRERVVKLGL